MNIIDIEKYFSDFANLTNNLDSYILSLSSFYSDFPFTGISADVSILNTFFNGFPYTTSLELKKKEFDYSYYFSCFYEQIALDKEALREHNSAINIWKSIGIGKHEVKHCHFLTWLFDPIGDHGQQDLFLRCFLQEIKLSSIYSGKKLFSVSREDSVGEFGRLDISIGNSQFWLIIEVKIDANEQTDQIVRYRNYLDKLSVWYRIPAENCKLIFLTPDTRKPRDLSVDVVCIGWHRISNAMELFCKDCRNIFVREIVNQYRDFIDNI
jgi:hypothetical protein